MVVSNNNIGIVYKASGDYVKALEYYTKSLSIELNTFGQNHPDVTTSFNNIAFVYKAKGDYNEALEYFTKCLSVKLITLGVDHP